MEIRKKDICIESIHEHIYHLLKPKLQLKVLLIIVTIFIATQNH